MNEVGELVLQAMWGRRVGRTGWVRANCPLCVDREGTEDRRTSLGLEVDTGWWRCWRCGARGKVEPDEAAASVQARKHARPRAQGAGSERADGADDEEQEWAQPPPGWFEIASTEGAAALCALPFRQYLLGRGVDEQAIREARCGAVIRGPHRGRVLVPVLSPAGEWLGWSGRALSRHTVPRYRYPNDMARDSIVWNAGALHVCTEEPALVVEGVFDGLPHWPNAVAVLGKPSERQLPILRTAARPLVIALDGDAWREGEALAWRLQLDGVQARAMRLPPRTDPGDITKAALAAQAKAVWS